jgi:hypothetical protein
VFEQEKFLASEWGVFVWKYYLWTTFSIEKTVSGIPEGLKYETRINCCYEHEYVFSKWV